MSKQFDVAVVGAGIVGLAHAWMAARRGLKVVLLERSPVAQGASVRNFGMVWPIGQPVGEYFELAMRSRSMWLELAEEAGVWVKPCGSLHLAHRADEWAVLDEFNQLQRETLNGAQLGIELLSPAETLCRTPAANPQGLLGSMWSPNELCVSPPQAIAAISRWLAERQAVQCEFNTTISQLEHHRLVASDGRSWQAERIVICSGIDFQTLLPAEFAKEPLRICKLHMLRTVAQAAGWQLGPHLASGLTLRHYSSFAACPSLAKLKARVQEETPELDRFGIHVMVSQNDSGQLILGDSHEYDADISPFDRAEIDSLILRELQKQFMLPDWTIEARWHGVYAKHRQEVMLQTEPLDGLHICVAPGGAGMTMSFGIAERFWNSISGRNVTQVA